jgi:hypothetical protein
MIRQNQSRRPFFAELNSVNAFRAQLIGAIPAMPVVISRRLVGVAGRTKAVCTPHWLSGFVTAPGVAAARKVVSPTDERAANPIATWSSYLPANCVEGMVSYDCDHITAIPNTSVLRSELSR